MPPHRGLGEQEFVDLDKRMLQSPLSGEILALSRMGCSTAYLQSGNLKSHALANLPVPTP